MQYVNLMRKRQLTLLILSFTLVLLLSGRAFAAEDQKAWLRMYASGSTYVYDDPDDWFAYSYVITFLPSSSISLTIDVTNHKGDQDVHDIVLPIVTNDTTHISSITVDGNLVTLSWSTGDLTMTADDGDDLGTMPPHGVYNDPTANWVEYRSGQDLGPAGSATDTISFSVTINFDTSDPGNVKIHFDAYGWVQETQKSPRYVDDTKDAATNPFSHDITILVPELALPLLATTSLSLCGYLLLKRKLTKT